MPSQGGKRLTKEHLKPDFLEAFKRIGTIVGAARTTNISREVVYLWCRVDADFKEKFDAAERELTERLESKLIEKALGGDLGSCIFLLKARSPQKYIERYQHQFDNTQFERLIGIFSGVIKRVVPQELWPRISAELEAAAEVFSQNKTSAPNQ
jgi:hypothetical protein